MSDFIEHKIIEAVRKMLAGRVNEIIGNWQAVIPVIEFGSYQSSSVVTPVIALAGCEQTEKERIIRLDAYSLSVTFTLPETEESELYCYAYADALIKALGEDVTLGGVADRAVISGKKYQPPKKPNCGEGWSVSISLRVTVEGMAV